jgi:hypothetical protein
MKSTLLRNFHIYLTFIVGKEELPVHPAARCLQIQLLANFSVSSLGLTTADAETILPLMGSVPSLLPRLE